MTRTSRRAAFTVALELYAKDVWELGQFVRRDFVVGRMVVTYAVRGTEVTKYLEDFQKEATTLGELRRIKLTELQGKRPDERSQICPPAFASKGNLLGRG